MDMKIRLATLDDAEDILAIYEPYILGTVITFEYDKIPLLDFKARMKDIMENYPWLVCTIEDKIVGYAYCSQHYVRAAYAWDCEYSIYISEEYHRKGIASKLSTVLFKLVKNQGYFNVYSLICVPNESSVTLHNKLGFKEVGTYYNTAYKFDSWLDVLIMEKQLQEPVGKPKPIIPFTELDNNIIEKCMKIRNN